MEKYHIEIVVNVNFQEDKSDIVKDIYRFTYHITLINRGAISAKLLSRHWVIKDALNKIEDVRGQGVIGEQPVLEPGQEYEYNSSVQIATPFGTMGGSYTWQASDGKHFETPIPEFALEVPRVIH